MAFTLTRLLIITVIWNFGCKKLPVVASIVQVVEDFCQYEHFQPRCSKNEVIIMTSATYGRMRIGRCITAKEVEAHRMAVGDDPRYFGCSANVLSILDPRCSGKTDCDIRVIDMALEDVEPCFPGLSGYLEVSYDCISVAEKERSCSVTATMNPIHIIGSTESQRICGTTRQPWTIESPVGQKIRISLIDLRASTSSDQTTTRIKQSCHSNYGAIVDRTIKRNVTICGDGERREKELHITSGNTVDILINQLDQKQGVTDATQFVLRLEAVGCSDLIPPEDAWLKRNDDSIVIGCYSSRQTWHLHCEGEKWIGVFGNCSQARYPVDLVESEPKSETWTDEQGALGNSYYHMVIAETTQNVSALLARKEETQARTPLCIIERNFKKSWNTLLLLVAVGGFTLTIFLVVLCTGIVCFRRYSIQSKKRQDYRTLNFQINSTRSQQVQPTTVSGNTVSNMPTYSVFVGESDFNDDDKSATFNQTNPSVRL